MQHNPGFLKLVTDAKSRVSETDSTGVKAMQDAREAFHLVDVREEGEFAAGHLPGSIHLGKGILERDVETKIPDHEDKIVLYCGGGFRSALSADRLQQMGYLNVLSMDGGFKGWVNAGFAVIKD
jgi:rhodanese-related sulfurtransferase